MDLPIDRQKSTPHLRRRFSRYGVMLPIFGIGAEDFPRHCPLDRVRFGFRRYERVDTWSRLHAGQVSLTRQGISLDLLLRPVDFSTGGPLFPTTSSRRREVRTISSSSSRKMAGVWSLRILNPRDESFLLIFRHGPCHRPPLDCHCRHQSRRVPDGYTGFSSI